MGKELIKRLLRETIFDRMREAAAKKKAPAGNDETSGGDENNHQPYHELSKEDQDKVKTLIIKVRNATQGPDRLLKLSQVMQKAKVRIGDELASADNATHRSLWGKYISGEPDDDGVVRYPTLADITKMGKVIDNPGAYD